MQQIQKHIANTLAVLLLILVQGLSIQALHSDDEPSAFYVQHNGLSITAKHLVAKNSHPAPTQKQKHGKHQRKMHHGKNISVKLSVPQNEIVTNTYLIGSDAILSALTPNYHYLYFRDINPPPPRA